MSILKFLPPLLLIQFPFVFHTMADQHDHISVYSIIQPVNLSSLSWDDEDWPNESFHDYLNRCLNYQLNPQELKKRRTVLKLFHALSTEPLSHNCLYDVSTMQDLQLIAGKGVQEPYIGEIIDRTYTQLGKIFLYGLISNPIDDIATLEARQSIVKFFVQDDMFSADLKPILEQFALSENMMLSLWTQDGFLNSTKRRYFSIPYFENINEKLNKSATALGVKSVCDHYQRAVFLLGGIFAATILPIYGLSQALELSLPEYLERVAKRLQGSGGRILTLIATLSKHKFFTAAMSLTAGVVCAGAIKEDYEWARDNVTLDMCLQEKMMHISNFLRNVRALSTLIQSNPEFIDVCPAAKHINTFIKTELSTASAQELFALCDSKTFDGSPSFFSLQGRILVAFKLVYDLKEKLQPFLMDIGEIDAYYSCASLYKEFENKPAHFCFAKYRAESVPSIVMNDFWNPFIDASKVVTNAINLQGLSKRSMIITGPNAGGKSTLIKAIPINLILSQSIGLAAASSAEITPFHTIATYLNIVDDIAVGNSLFKAQVLRAQEMINVVEQTPINMFSFVALDEMFNGTSPKESMAAAYSVVKHIGQYENNICIVATHFSLLTTLEEEPAFENYKVSVDMDQHNKIHYPFTLQRGISEQHVALDILKQEGYDCSIIEEATDILNNLG